ncbi:ATP-binding protein [Paraburkholderia sp. BCC1876]|uniref:AAA family ATPase n=1 Tax=Paraburkholderia sp. BCC1876 TaxID=2676303 RepID=UPI001590C8A8|nr:ATP-binding protein [Paraburkholderia sp. BCC1876]
MSQVHIVFGPQGAGKSFYARKLAESCHATRFSIDEWMAGLYGPDLPSPMNLAWIMERVQRCERQIWSVAQQIVQSGAGVVLDLGFMKVESRSTFIARASDAGIAARLHYVTAPYDLRKRRVTERNEEKGATFAFEVTPAMFEFMEAQFEAATEVELAAATVIESLTDPTHASGETPHSHSGR